MLAPDADSARPGNHAVAACGYVPITALCAVTVVDESPKVTGAGRPAGSNRPVAKPLPTARMCPAWPPGTCTGHDQVSAEASRACSCWLGECRLPCRKTVAFT